MARRNKEVRTFVCATCGKPWIAGKCSGKFINHTECVPGSHTAPRTPMQYQVPALTPEVLGDAQNPEQSQPGTEIVFDSEKAIAALGDSPGQMADRLDEIGIPEMDHIMGNRSADEDDEDEDIDPDVVIPDEATAALINSVIAGGAEFQVQHAKLKEIMDVQRGPLLTL